MKAVSKILTGAAGVAALVGMAAPAAAQYYPGYNTGGNVVGQVLGAILNPYGGQQQYNPYGGQQYGVNPQLAVQQCSIAVQQRLARYSSGYNPYGGGYGGYGGGYGGYDPYGGYGNAQSGARVVAVSRVEPRSASTLRVRGYATSGMYAGYAGTYGGNGGYSGYNGYGAYNPAQSADLSFKCDIDYRGQIRDIDINRRY